MWSRWVTQLGACEVHECQGRAYACRVNASRGRAGRAVNLFPHYRSATPTLSMQQRRCWRCCCYTNVTKMVQIRILVAPRPQWALSCLKVDITAWTRQDITTPDLAGAVRLAVNRGVKLETINRVLGDVGLRWDTPAGDLRSSVHGELGRRR